MLKMPPGAYRRCRAHLRIVASENNEATGGSRGGDQLGPAAIDLRHPDRRVLLSVWYSFLIESRHLGGKGAYRRSR